MRTLPILILAGLALAGCASSNLSKPPVCDGKHRRAANPYGSVLAPKTRPSTLAPAPGEAPASKADKLSAIAPAAFGSCRA
jgi:hypothetical protein